MMSTFSKGFKFEIKVELSCETFTNLQDLMNVALKTKDILDSLSDLSCAIPQGR